MDRRNPKTFPTQPARLGRKVVSIPVHFVGSESRRSTSAVKIQKVLRGFLVRKTMKEIVSIRREVDKAERRVLDTIDTIRTDPKERLKMNETLMGLLFKLDSVRSVGPGVRDCRKAVIKRAIILQEIIDGCDGSVKIDGNRGLEVDGVTEKMDGCDESSALEIDGMDYNENVSGNCDQGLELEDLIKKMEGFDGSSADVANQALEIEGQESKVCLGHNDKIDGCDESDADVASHALEIEGQKSKVVLGHHDEIDGCDESGADMAKGIEFHDKVLENIDQGSDEEMIENELLNCENFLNHEDGEEESEEDYCFVKQVVVREGEDRDIEKDSFNGKIKVENGREREMLEKMMEENGKMMSMMKQLAEQNQAQTQMLGLLSQRVEQLEKAFVKEISKKKIKDKKKRAANGVMDGSDCSPDQKKCGKKR